MKVCSIFSQVLKLFSRGEFEKAVKEHKAERIGWDWVPEGPTQPQETQPYESMQHFLAGVETVFARGIRKGGEGAQGRAARARVDQLGSVHGEVVLPVGPGAFVARDLRWTGVLRGAVEAFGGAGGSQEVPAGLRQ